MTLKSTDKDTVSMRFLKNELGLSGVSKDQLKTIYDRIEDILGLEWEKEGRSWRRYPINPEAIHKYSPIGTIGV